MCSGRVEMQANEDLQQIHDGHRNYSSHPNAKCSWLVKAELDESESPFPIEINVTFFETECGWDHLYIYDGTSSLKSTLLASLCGISNNPPLLYATSGHAFLHFYSDMAYNMSGFDLTIRSIAMMPEPLNPMPALVENTGFGLLTLDRSLLPEEMTARALPSSVRVGAKVFIWGGYQFPDFNSESDDATWLIDLDGAIEPKKLDYSSPPIRYGAPATIFKKTHALIYGGVKFPDYHLFNDLWVLDTSQNIGWTQAKATSFFEDQTAEKLFTMAGHSMVTVNFKNGTELILCFGGYVDDAGFVSLTVELVPHEERIDQFFFRYPETLGFRVPGSYGHVSVVDPENPSNVYLYGGFQNNNVRNELVLYDATTRIFTQLRTAESAARRWLHAGGIVGRHLIFLSGNSHTDTSHSSGTLCYSDEILLYSIECGKWTTIQSSEKWFPRYGSASISLEDKVMLIGGYDGELKNEIITFKPSEIPDECSVVTRTNDDSCERVDKNPFAAPTYCSSCVFKNSHRDDGCHYCADSSGTERDTCAATPEKGYRNTNTCYSNVQDCPDFKQWTCSLSHKRCTSCITSGCSYVVKSDNEKRHYSCILPDSLATTSNITRHNTLDSCLKGTDTTEFECGVFKTCGECVGEKNTSTCMWCGRLGVCVSNESYVSSFPFGQCFEWFNKDHCDKTECAGHKTCKSCQSDPRCGWCDDGTQTGSGTCMDGTLFGSSKSSTICPTNNWFWVHCPTCNCSGHSKCDRNNQNVCLNCAQENTAGANCERCAEGYHGNALNGGTCEKCDCSKNSKSCDYKTGKCHCTTKGISGNRCDECNIGNKYWGDPENSSCYYNITGAFAYSFRLNKEDDKAVTALNCHVIEIKEEPDIEVEVTIDDSAEGFNMTNKFFMVNVTTFLPNEKEVLINGTTSATKKYVLNVPHKEYKFGNKTQRSMRIYIHHFSTPIFIKVQVRQQSRMSLLTFFLVFFACFLSLLLLAVIGWKLKTMYDLYLQRRAVLNEMREMAARPFAQVHLSTEKPIVDEPPQPVCYEILEDQSAAVATSFLLLPRHPDGSPPVGLSSLCFGSVMIAFEEKLEQSLLLPVLPPPSRNGVDNPTCTDNTPTPT